MTDLIEHVRDVYWPTAEVIWPSLLAAAALALAGGVIGVFVLLRREALLTLALPQLVTLGAAVGIRFQWDALPPEWRTVAPAAGAVTVALALLAGSRRRDSGTLLLPALYLAGLCVSMLVVANAAAHLSEVQNLFTGMDVAVEVSKAKVVAALLACVALACAALWRRWLLLAQMPTAARLARLRPAWWNALFLLLLAAVVVPATDALGPIMVVVMLFLPASVVLPWTRRVPTALIGAVATALLSLLAGFVLSIDMGWPLSHSVGAAGLAMFAVSHAAARVFRPGIGDAAG